MRPIGFSTGALAYGDFRQGLSIIRNQNLKAIELSALRETELKPLIDSLDNLELNGFEHVSFHVPSQLKAMSEEEAVVLLDCILRKSWPLIVHPDIIENFDLWRRFGKSLCIENMDKRKPIGRTDRELGFIFAELPQASLCLDLGHARQVDPTMSVAWEILEEFGSRLSQLHVSEVNTNSRHDPLSYEAALAFRKISILIPESVPVILESRVSSDQVEREVLYCREALSRLAAA